MRIAFLRLGRTSRPSKQTSPQSDSEDSPDHPVRGRRRSPIHVIAKWTGPALSRTVALMAGVLMVFLALHSLEVAAFAHWALLVSLVGGFSVINFGTDSGLVTTVLRRSSGVDDHALAQTALQQCMGNMRQVAPGGLTVGLLAAMASTTATYLTGSSATTQLRDALIVGVATTLAVTLAPGASLCVAAGSAKTYYWVTGINSTAQILILAFIAGMTDPPMEAFLLAAVIPPTTGPLLNILAVRMMVIRLQPALSVELDKPLATRRDMYRAGLPFQIANITGAIAQHGSPWLLTVFSTLDNVARFQMGHKLFGVAFSFLHAWLIQSWIQQLRAGSKRTALNADLRTCALAATAFGLTESLLVYLLQPHLGLAFAFPPAHLLLWSLWLVGQTCGTLLYNMSTARGHHRLRIMSPITNIMVLIPLAAIASHEFGAMGLLVAIVACHTLLSIAPFYFILRRDSPTFVDVVPAFVVANQEIKDDTRTATGI